MSRMERRRDRAAPDPQCSGDRLVVEIRVVAKKEHEALALRQGRNRRPQLGPPLGVEVLMHGLDGSLRTTDALPLCVTADVDKGSPQPALK